MAAIITEIILILGLVFTTYIYIKKRLAAVQIAKITNTDKEPLPGAVRVTINPAYGVVIESVTGLGTVPYRFYPITVASPFRSYSTNTAIGAGKVIIKTSTSVTVHPVKISIYKGGKLLDCTPIDQPGSYELKLINDVVTGDLLIAVEGGRC